MVKICTPIAQGIFENDQTAGNSWFSQKLQVFIVVCRETDVLNWKISQNISDLHSLNASVKRSKLKCN